MRRLTALAVTLTLAAIFMPTSSANLSPPAYIAQQLQRQANQHAAFAGIPGRVYGVRCMNTYKGYYCVGKFTMAGYVSKLIWNVREAANGDWRAASPVVIPGV